MPDRKVRIEEEADDVVVEGLAEKDVDRNGRV